MKLCKKIISLILAVLMATSALTVVDFSAYAADNSDMNRATWISKLVDVFDMTVEKNNYPDNYFSDIDESSKYYRDIMIATEFGLLDIEAGSPVNPEGLVTREFAAHTLNFCLGFSLDAPYTDNENSNDGYSYSFSDTSKCTYPIDDQVAINRNWFDLDENNNFNPDARLTDLECNFMIADAKSVLKKDTVDESHTDKYEFADYVKVIPNGTILTVDNNYNIVVLNCPIDIFDNDIVAVFLNDMPIVRKVVSVEVKNNVTKIKSSEVDTDGAIVNVDMENSTNIDVSNFVPVEGLEVVKENKETRDVAFSDKEISLDGSVDINGVSVKLTAKISNIGLNTKVNSQNKECMAVLSYNAELKFDTSVKAQDVSVLLGGVEAKGIGEVGIYLNINLNGNASISQKFKCATGFSYSLSDGLRDVYSFQKEEFTFNLQVSGSVGLKAKAGIDTIILKAEIYASVGFKGNVTNLYSDKGLPRMCTTIEAYLYLDLGYSFSVNLLLVKFENKGSKSIFKLDNSPIRIYFHLEDGYFVDKCSKGTKFNYLTSKDSTIAGVNTEYFANLSKEKEFLLTYQIDVSDLKYTVVNNKVTILAYTGYEGKYRSAAIPSEINGKKVTKIAKNAFKNSGLTSVIIPKTVEILEDYSFYGLNSLEKIVILNDNIKIGNHVFDWQMGTADQTVGNVPVYCNMNSNAYEFSQNSKGFSYHSLAWDGTTVWGVASKSNIYHIYTAQELAYISAIVKNGYDLNNCEIQIEANIDLNSFEWYPIGTFENPYRGAFNGKGNTVKNIRPKILGIEKDSQISNSTGLFGYIEPSKNVSFKNINITQTVLCGHDSSWNGFYVGGLIGSINANNVDVDISNIEYLCNVAQGNNWSFDPVYQGGIIGYIKSLNKSNINIYNCINKGYISSSSYSGGTCCGGIVAVTNLSDDTFLNLYQCASTKDIWSNESVAYDVSYSGGIIAKASGGNYIFKECATEGYVYDRGNGSIAKTGALVAEINPRSIKVENCEFFSHIWGESNQASGMIGYLNTSNIDNSKSYIKNSYISAYVQGGGTGAILCCSNKDSFNLPIINTYFNNDTSKLRYFVSCLTGGGFFYNTDGVEGKEWCVNSSFKTGNELKTNHALYDEWDFVNVWKYDESGYPILKCFENITPCSEHNYINKIVSPTCTAKGYTTHTCSKCGYTYNDNYVDALGHDYSVYSKTVAPTCTDKGYDVYNCSRGDSWTKYNLVPALGHNYSENATGHKNPTCTDKGYDEYTCSRCNNIEKRNYVDALGHLYSEKPTAHKDPTCNSKGYDEYTCSRCNGTKRDEIAALDGSALTSALDDAKKKMESGVFTDESVSACQKVCDKYQNAVNELHSQAEVDNATAEVTSAYENLVLKDIVTGTLDNGMTWTFTKDGAKLSFAGEGEVPYYAIGSNPWYYCGNIETLEFGEGITSIAGSAFTKYNTVKKINFPSTLTTINIRAFEYCYAVEELVIPDSVTFIGYGTFASLTSLKRVTVPASVGYASYAFEHDEQVEKIIITPGVDGIMPECIRTNNIGFFGSKYTGAFGPWRVAKNAIVTVQDGITSIGLNTFYNAVSGNLTINIPASVNNIGKTCFATNGKTVAYVGNGNCVIDETNLCLSNVNVMVKSENGEYAQKPHTHTWSDWHYNNDAVYNSSSDYKDGTQTRTCSVCGESETKEAPNTALLRRRGNALSLESSITLATYITKDVVDYYDEVYAEFTRNGKIEKVYPSDKTLTSNSTVYCIFYYTGISPQALGDNVSITFYGIKDGVTYNGNAYKYSATEYIKSTLKSTTSAKLKTLLVDLVYYGEACQVYQNYKTDNLLTDILTDEQKAFHSTGDLNLTNIKNSKYSLCDNRLVKFGTALRLNNSVKMAIAMNMTNVTLEELSLKVKKGSRTMTYSYSKNPENFGKGKDGYWYFYFDGVYANQMSDEVLITAYKGSEQVSYTLKYSVESYAAIVTDAKIKAVTDAMMRYGNSAKAYVGK